jgi:hypothetical protein
VEITRPDRSVHPLASSLARATDPSVSFDGSTLLFSGKRSAEDPWSIWQMRTDGTGLRQVTDGKTGNDFWPCHLPDGSFVCVRTDRMGVSDIYRTPCGAKTCDRLTYTLAGISAPAVLRDGRILFVQCGSTAQPGLYVVRPDGTAYSAFYTDDWAARISAASDSDGSAKEGERSFTTRMSGPDWPSRPFQLDSGDIVFFRPSGTGFEAISYEYPFTDRRLLGKGEPGHFHSACALRPGVLAVSYRPPGEQSSYGLYEFSVEQDRLGPVIYDDPQWHEVLPVATRPRKRPPALAHTVNKSKKEGRIYGLNAAFSGTEPPSEPPSERLRPAKVCVRFEDPSGWPMGPKSCVEAPVKPDGSFYLEIPANTPFLLETLAADGSFLARCCRLWVQPNESRGCVGCHESPVLAPQNTAIWAIDKTRSEKEKER